MRNKKRGRRSLSLYDREEGFRMSQASQGPQDFLFALFTSSFSILGFLVLCCSVREFVQPPLKTTPPHLPMTRVSRFLTTERGGKMAYSNPFCPDVRLVCTWRKFKCSAGEQGTDMVHAQKWSSPENAVLESSLRIDMADQLSTIKTPIRVSLSSTTFILHSPSQQHK